MLYKLARFVFFLFDAEAAHYFALKSLRFLDRAGVLGVFTKKTFIDPVDVMGVHFPNRVGLAAGLDKNAEYINALSKMGFGFLEVGTVTPKPQPGNDKPRLFRVIEAQGIINRMGFNNYGVDALVNHVRSSGFKGVLGINIGKNIFTPVDNAVDDYVYCLEHVYEFADYVAVNISSPNTPGLRKLQHGEALVALLNALKSKQQDLSVKHNHYVPLAVKIAPDLTDDEIDELASAFLVAQVDAVIATNTTSSRDGVEGMKNADEQGGLSGAPVFEKSTEVLQKIVKRLEGKIPVIAVGGITTAHQAVEKIKAGASLVQIYSGFIYQGPDLIYQSARAISEMSGS